MGHFMDSCPRHMKVKYVLFKEQHGNFSQKSGMNFQ